ncbi:hypothetical protein [Nodularia spumigena]|uniref:hypothetical protein n=1 Tax=Nodularia spumigena TaxID=70799 RepID=UPI002B2048F4|nr:hypothetical protein [Nodularia spumigena]MEA5557614.1 hypothetical protein [Nodularia spumigena CH309]
MSIILLSASATPWALLLTVAGLWLATIGASQWPSMSAPCLLGGLASLAAGQFVFACLVADRVFPGADRRLVLGFEILTCVALLLGVLGVIVTVGLGLSSATLE